MQYDVVIGERTRRVMVQRADKVWRVTVDGEVSHVDAVRIDEALLSLLVGPEGPGMPSRSVPVVVIAGRTPGELGVHVNGRQLTVTVADAGRARRRRGAAVHEDGPQRVTASMAGKVVRVLVAVGEAVEAGQGLVVVEAMKMENELRAAKAGHVASIPVTEGQSVDAGAVLAVVE